MDIGELIIRIQATAEGLETTLNAATQKVQQFARQAESVIGKPMLLNVKTEGMDKARTEIRSLESSARSLSEKPIELEIGSEKLKADMDDVSRKVKNLSSVPLAIKAEGGGIRQLNLDLTMLTKSAEGFWGVVDKLSGETINFQFEGTAEQFSAHIQQMSVAMQEAVDGMEVAFEDAANGMDKLVEGYQKIPPAATQAGSAAQQAGAQSAAGAFTATAATVVWENAVKKLKSTLSGVGASLILYPLLNGFQNWISSLIKAEEEMKKLRQEQMKANEEAIQASLKSASEHRENMYSIRSLAEEYAELARKKRTTSEDKRFLELQEELALAMGTTGEAVQAQALSIDAWTEAVNRAANSEADKVLEDMRKANEIQAEQVRIANEKAGQGNISYGQAGRILKMEGFTDSDVSGMLIDETIVPAIKEAQEKYREQAAGLFETTLQEMRNNKEKFSEGMAQVLKTGLVDSILLAEDYAASDEQSAWMDNFINNQINGLKDVLTNADIASGTDAYVGLLNKVLFGDMSAEDAAPQLTEKLNGIQQAAYEAFVGMGDSCETANEKAIALRDSITGGETDMLKYARSVANSNPTLAEYAANLGKMQESLTGMKRKLDAVPFSKQVKDWRDIYAGMTTGLKSLLRLRNSLATS